MSTTQLLEPETRPIVGRPKVELWGLPFVPITMDGLLDAVDLMIARQTPHFVITANLNYAMLTERSAELREVNEAAALVVADGMPMVWASRLATERLPERVTGADLAPAVCGHAAEKGYRVYLMGGAEGVADEAAARLVARFPTLQIVGIYCPPFRPLDERENDELVERIRAAAPDILFVASSQPRGEIWLYRNHQRLGIPVQFQIGASIDFLAGRVHRAPVWVRRVGLEWGFRLAQEPRRLAGRYWSNGKFLLRAVGRQVVDRLRGAAPEPAGEG